MRILILTSTLAAKPVEAESAAGDAATDAPGSDAIQPGYDAQHSQWHANGEQEQPRQNCHGEQPEQVSSPGGRNARLNLLTS